MDESAGRDLDHGIFAALPVQVLPFSVLTIGCVDVRYPEEVRQAAALIVDLYDYVSAVTSIPSVWPTSGDVLLSSEAFASISAFTRFHSYS
jgi:predicted amidohydrolase